MTVYLDYNATTPLLDVARAAWLSCQEHTWGNASSTHMYGQQAQNALDAAKNSIAQMMSCRGHELIVCGSGTEANALAIHAAMHVQTDGAQTDSDCEKDDCEKGKREILCGAAEHSSILRNAQQHGCSVHHLAVDAHAAIDPDALRAALNDHTRLVCMQFANNEVGTLQDIPSLVTLIRAYRADIHIHIDACQGTGKQVINCDALNIDSLSFTGHKFGAPKGSGMLYVRSGVKVQALIHGGQQQQDRRSGTEDIAAISALAAAMRWSLARAEAEAPRQRSILAACWQQISTALPEAQWLAHDAQRLAGTMSIAHPDVLSSALIPRLDLSGFALSPGSACMAARGGSSHVILAMGVDPQLARSVIRVSIGGATTADEIHAFANAYIQEVRNLIALNAPA